ncbi:hypothetical protein A6R68_15647, partial [Neotoma lepida]
MPPGLGVLRGPAALTLPEPRRERPQPALALGSGWGFSCNPPCVGKGEEEEDLNIEDCYVPQRSIYDTVRLNEQIDSGSKAECNMASKGDVEAPFSAQEMEVTQKKGSLQFIPVKKKTGLRKMGVQAGTLDPVCNGFQLVQVFQKEEIEPLQVKQQDVNWLGQGLIQSAAA